MRNRCISEIRQWNIRKQATILDLARKNRNVLFKYMRHRRINKPSTFSLRDRNGEATSDTIVVSEFYRDHYAGIGPKCIRRSTDDLLHILPYYSHGLPSTHGAYVRALLEYANPVVHSGRKKDVSLIQRVRRAVTKIVAGLKSMDYETRLAGLDLFLQEYRRMGGFTRDKTRNRTLPYFGAFLKENNIYRISNANFTQENRPSTFVRFILPRFNG
ncbi:hypothetical protein CLF_102486 [Clonorchis sinensis]|uniref:Uncharacterized protein n=1 Tax=Clonorchis sinensis TaxID=79923 RepID=G7Y815_CLOSI|nr:hypothetical protein CLF_102486 [Clonorchis sinensis]